MKTKTIQITRSEFIETDDGGYFKHTTRKEEFPDDGRHSDLCVVCGFSTYPECRSWCQHGGCDENYK